MQITRRDTTPELWEKLLKQCHHMNADVIDIQVVGSEIYSEGDPRKAKLEKPSGNKTPIAFPEYDRIVHDIEAARPSGLRLTQNHYFGIRLCYDAIGKVVGHG